MGRLPCFNYDRRFVSLPIWSITLPCVGFLAQSIQISLFWYQWWGSKKPTAIFFNGCPVQTSHDFAQVVVFLVIPRNKIGHVLCKGVKMNNCRPCMERIGSTRERDIWRRNGVAHSKTTKWAIFSKTKSSKQTFCWTKVKRRGGYCKFVLHTTTVYFKA